MSRPTSHWCHGVSVSGPVDPSGCCADQPPTAAMIAEEYPPLTPDQRRRFIAAAERGMRPRRAILRLAASATGHHKHPHGDSCDDCGLTWPCVIVRRAAGPALDAVADLSPDPTPEPTAASIAAGLRAEVDRAAADRLAKGLRGERA